MYLNLLLQRIIGFCCLILFLYPILWIWVFIIKRYKIENLKNIRNTFKTIKSQITEPLIICPNHLTYIDSIMLLLAFGSWWYYIWNYYTLSWNFPKTEHIKNNLFYKIFCYLGKCIFLDLNSSTEQPKIAMKQAVYLLSKGEYLMLFPEGHRSLTGVIDTKNFMYGVGQLVLAVPNTKILCVYLRGSSQQARSNFPKTGDNFYCRLKLINPIDESTNTLLPNNSLRAMRNISKNIITNLAAMEQDYFAHTRT